MTLGPRSGCNLHRPSVPGGDFISQHRFCEAGNEVTFEALCHLAPSEPLLKKNNLCTVLKRFAASMSLFSLTTFNLNACLCSRKSL